MTKPKKNYYTSFAGESTNRWSKWKPKPGDGEMVPHPGKKALLKQLQNDAYLEGRRLTNADRIKAGLRPRRDDKPDSWIRLTPTQKRVSLARSKEHMERQLALGIPIADIYGPWTVLNCGAKWDTKLTHNHTDK